MNAADNHARQCSQLLFILPGTRLFALGGEDIGEFPVTVPEVPAGGDVEAQPDDEASDPDLPGWQFDGQQGSQDYIGDGQWIQQGNGGGDGFLAEILAGFDAYSLMAAASLGRSSSVRTVPVPGAER